MFDVMFFIYSVSLGAGLAMDAFSVSLADGLSEPCMKKRKLFGIAGVFAVFQALMPFAGWVCVHTIANHFKVFEKLIPWIALLLLGYIGGKMLFEGIKNKDACPIDRPDGIGFTTLMVQGVATSIDALSAGFTISDYNLPKALMCVAVIAAVTFVICSLGVALGRKAGTTLAGKAGILGGAILIFIGLEIFITSWF